VFAAHSALVDSSPIVASGSIVMSNVSFISSQHIESVILPTSNNVRFSLMLLDSSLFVPSGRFDLSDLCSVSGEFMSFWICFKNTASIHEIDRIKLCQAR
jgi:hypothetical protein